MKQVRIAFVSSLFSLALVGCGSDDKNSGTDGEQPLCKENTFSPFKGDCLKLEKPEEGKGLQLHFGPTNYDDQAEVDRYTIGVGVEQNVCLFMTAPNTEDLYFSEYHGTVRPGSHHMIIFGAPATENTPPDGTLEKCDAWPGGRFHFVVGAQNGLGPEGGRIDFPSSKQAVPEESKDTAYVLKAGAKPA